MDLKSLPSRTLVAYAAGEAFAPNTIRILSRLGYEIVTPEEFAARVAGGGKPNAQPEAKPDAYLVDKPHLGSVPGEREDDSVPVVLLGAEAEPGADARTRAVVRTPVGMHDLYRALQQLFEDQQRSIPRVPTDLSAVCRRSGHEWNASVRSLSENGCLLCTPEPVPLGTELQLAFEIPNYGTVHLLAETAYELLPDLGLVFSSIAPQIREAINAYVTEVLLAPDPARPGATR